MKKFLYLLCIAALFSMSASAAEADDIQLETIMVTAEKRSEDAQKVAVPMNVMTNVFVQDKGMSKMSDLSRYIPGMSLNDDFAITQTWAAYRGMSTNEMLYTSPIVLSIDGMATDSTHGFSTTFEDIERIEVMRGPQGTLYGKNSMTGAINVITKKPGNNLTGSVGFAVEERNTYKTKFGVSGPIKKDSVFFGLSGGYEQTDGYIEDHTLGGRKDIAEKDRLFYSAKLRFTPGKDNDIMLKYSRSHTDSYSSPVVFSDSPTYDITTGLTKSEFDGSDSTIDSFILNMAFKRQLFDLASITSYRYVDTDQHILRGFSSPYTLGAQKFKEPSITQELRVNSKDSSKVKWLLGAYYETDKRDYDEMSMSSSTVKYDYQPVTKSSTYAVFAETTLPVFSDKFAVTLGGRYEKTGRDFDYYSVYTMNGVPLMENSYSAEKDWSSSLGKIAFTYNLTQTSSIYFTVAQGYIPGGFNITSDVKDSADFNETKSLNYEMGFKSKLLSNRLMLNANVYHIDYDDLQVMERDMSTNIYTVKNAGKAHSTGIETDIMYKPLRGLDIFATAGLSESKYDDFKDYSGEYDKKYMMDAPKFTAAAGATYRHSSGFMTTFDVKQTGKTYFAKDNNSDKVQDTYAIFNVKAGYESEKGYDVYLYVRNLTDKEYFTYMRDSGVLNYMGEPRTVGMEVNYRF